MTTIGTEECEHKPDIVVSGSGMQEMMAYVNHTVEYDPTEKRLREQVMFHPLGKCYVDEVLVDEAVLLVQGNTVRLGDHQLFRFNHPTEAHHLRKLRESGAATASTARVFDPQRQLEERHRREEAKLAQEKAALEAEKVPIPRGSHAFF
jgi:hypothetical protein